MRKISRVFMAVLTMVIAITGCQSTPDKPVVIQKDMEQMIEKGMEEDTASQETQNISDYSQLCAFYGVPERFQTNLSEGKLVINCDVEIELPEVTAPPMARVESGEFAQERVYTFWNALVGETPMYVWPEQPDKEYYEQQILEQRAKLAVATDENTSRAIDSTIEELEKEYQSAPDHNELIPADGTLQTKEMREFNIDETLGNYTSLNATSAPYKEGAMTFNVHNDVENKDAGIYSGKDENGNIFTLALSSTATLGFSLKGEDIKYGDWERKILSDVTALSLSGGAAEDCKLSVTPNQARVHVEAFLKETGVKDLIIDTVLLCSSQMKQSMGAAEGGYYVVGSSLENQAPETQAYVFRILRQLGGIKVESTHEMSQTSVEISQDDEKVMVGKEWAYEYMAVAVDDNGIPYLRWQAPLEVTEVLTENTAILPWSEIKDVFEKMIVIKNAIYEDSNSYTSVRFDITRVSLSLQRVMERDSFATGLLVPVWNFYGTITLTEEQKDPMVLGSGYVPLIFINAIDGTVIDIASGY